MSTPDQVPSELIAGDTWSWTRDLADYPATTHSAAWYFENKDNAFSVNATTSGTTFVGTVVPASTGKVPGRYRWRIVVTRTSDNARFTAETGWTDVQADPVAAGKMDVRSHARRTLDAIEAAIEGRATSDQQAMSIGSGPMQRALTRIPIEELLKFRDYYQAIVDGEDNADAVAAGGVNSRRMGVRFNRV
jgi:hypothetical protein